MNVKEELLFRCFDEDLNDDEMKKLFVDLSKDDDLRNSFRNMLRLQHDLQMISKPTVPHALDMQMKTLSSSSRLSNMPDRPLLRRIVSKKISLSIPAFAAAMLLMLLGSYILATNVAVQKPKMEYVYVVEMPAYVVQSNYNPIKNN
ncbi:MAG: hypothetical protein WDA22_03590 [Bacteroidota bacterium]